MGRISKANIEIPVRWVSSDGDFDLIIPFREFSTNFVKKIETNELGAVTRLVETADWQEVNAVVIDNARCIRCGECMRVCPVDCISATRVELVERMAEKGKSYV